MTTTYSGRYYDDVHEYRHVVVPLDRVPESAVQRLLKETEWRALGLEMSCGWVHYGTFVSDVVAFLFKRPISFDNRDEWQRQTHLAKADAMVDAYNADREARAKKKRQDRERTAFLFY